MKGQPHREMVARLRVRGMPLSPGGRLSQELPGWIFW